MGPTEKLTAQVKAMGDGVRKGEPCSTWCSTGSPGGHWGQRQSHYRRKDKQKKKNRVQKEKPNTPLSHYTGVFQCSER